MDEPTASEELGTELRGLKIEQVAEIVQLSPKTVMRAILSGDLEASQLTGGRGGWRVRERAIAAWYEARSAAAPGGGSPICVREILWRSPADPAPLGARRLMRADSVLDRRSFGKANAPAGHPAGSRTSTSPRARRRLDLALQGSMDRPGKQAASRRGVRHHPGGT
jgi:Helix-turn-helix domain